MQNIVLKVLFRVLAIQDTFVHLVQALQTIGTKNVKLDITAHPALLSLLDVLTANIL